MRRKLHVQNLRHQSCRTKAAMGQSYVQFLAVSVTLHGNGSPRLQREVLPLEIGYARIDLQTAQSSCHVVIDTTADAVVLSTAGSGNAEVELDFLVTTRATRALPLDAVVSHRNTTPTRQSMDFQSREVDGRVGGTPPNDQRRSSAISREFEPRADRTSESSAYECATSSGGTSSSETSDGQPRKIGPHGLRRTELGARANCAIETWCLSEDFSVRSDVLDGLGRVIAPSPSGRTPSCEPMQLPHGRYLLRTVRSRGLGIVRIACVLQ